jgi:ribosomal protein L13E
MKNILPYESTSKAIKNYDDSVIAKHENRDCVVRAFASCFEIPYDTAHKYVKEKFGRKDRQGTYGTSFKMQELAKNRTQINYKKVKCVGKINNFGVQTLDYEVKVKGVKVNRKMTVGTFTQQNPVGTFFMLVTGHAFTIKDGVVIGNYEDSIKIKRPLKSAFKIN